VAGGGIEKVQFPVGPLAGILRLYLVSDVEEGDNGLPCFGDQGYCNEPVPHLPVPPYEPELVFFRHTPGIDPAQAVECLHPFKVFRRDKFCPLLLPLNLLLDISEDLLELRVDVGDR